MDIIEIATINENREFGTPVTEDTYVILKDNFSLSGNANATYPTKEIKLNGWEGTSYMRLLKGGVVEVTTGLGDWWGAGLEIKGNGKGENLTEFANGTIHFEMRCESKSSFEVGFQTGHFANGTQTNNFADFGPQKKYATSKDWKSYSLKISELNNNAKLDDVTGLLIFREIDKMDGKKVFLRNIYYSKS